MKTENIPPIKVRIQYEFAYQIIYYSLIFIMLGFAYVFASNLLAFNWFTVIFVVFALLLIYLKKESFILIYDGTLTITYWKFHTPRKIPMDSIKEFTFYADKQLFEIYLKNGEVVSCYLKKKQKEQLLSYIILHFPNIPCILID